MDFFVLVPISRCGGRAISVEYTEKLAALAKWYNLKLHIDGARIMNAAVVSFPPPVPIPGIALLRQVHSMLSCQDMTIGSGK